MTMFKCKKCGEEFYAGSLLSHEMNCTGKTSSFSGSSLSLKQIPVVEPILPKYEPILSKINLQEIKPLLKIEPLLKIKPVIKKDPLFKDLYGYQRPMPRPIFKPMEPMRMDPVQWALMPTPPGFMKMPGGI